MLFLQHNWSSFLCSVDVGDSCRVRGKVPDHPMAEFYCLNCAPTQPQFLVGTTVYICQEWVDDKFGTGSELFTKYVWVKRVFMASTYANIQ